MGDYVLAPSGIYRSEPKSIAPSSEDIRELESPGKQLQGKVAKSPVAKSASRHRVWRDLVRGAHLAPDRVNTLENLHDYADLIKDIMSFIMGNICAFILINAISVLELPTIM